ncbi:hypothetical protein H0H93_012626 [Arthromyces matolae]|nr:hypothetical protein H0H93_012626 [Arthromyces matolae]
MSSSTGASFKGTKPSENPNRHDPKFIGEIPGYPVGSKFTNRSHLSAAGVHAPLRGGIHGNKEHGAYSVVLSYGYEDDEDGGETLHGSLDLLNILLQFLTWDVLNQGGRSTDSSKLDQMQGKESWSSHQTSDQEWKLGNKALQISCEFGKPVRVIRGASRKNPELHRFAPAEGLRYDGLYKVAKAWKDVGVTGFKTCKFLFVLPRTESPNSSRSLSVPSVPTKRPRVAHVPLPPYRPSAEDIARLKAKGKSKSHTPESIGSRGSRDAGSTSQANITGRRSAELTAKSASINISNRALLSSKINNHTSSTRNTGSSRSDALSSHHPPIPNFARKRAISISDDEHGSNGEGSELNNSDSEEDSPWASVRGKQRLPMSLNFKKRKVAA